MIITSHGKVMLLQIKLAENLLKIMEAYSEEKGECSHQNIMDFEQGQYNEKMMGDLEFSERKYV